MYLQLISSQWGFSHREVVKHLSEKLSRHMRYWREHMELTTGAKGVPGTSYIHSFANVPHPFGGFTFILIRFLKCLPLYLPTV